MIGGPSSSSAATAASTKPVGVRLTLAGTMETVAGTVVRYDGATVVVRTGAGAEREVKWAALTRFNHYATRKQLIDPASAADWRELARLAKTLELGDEAAEAAVKAAALEAAAAAKKKKTDGAGTTTTTRPSGSAAGGVGTSGSAAGNVQSVTVTLAGAGGAKVAGELTRHDANSVTLSNETGEHTFTWSQLSAISQHTLRSQLMDRSSAAAWLDLAALAMRNEMREQAKIDAAYATQIDPTARLKAEAILRSNAATAGPIKYKKTTPEEDAHELEIFQLVGRSVAEKMGLPLVEVQSTHFMIYTDWGESRYEYLCGQCEDAYAAVSKQFDIPVTENVFVGKLLIFMFNKREDYNRFGTTIDAIPGGTILKLDGYFYPHVDGSGHMAMPNFDLEHYKNEAERQWRYTLTHEFTHAFVSRYRSNRPIPRWLNEGLAEWIAFQRFPRKGVHAFARRMAGLQFDFPSLFDDKKMPGGEMYPVMQTMVEALIVEDRRAFITMFDEIKNGTNPETAMRWNYHAGYADWEPAWRAYARRLKD